MAKALRWYATRGHNPNFFFIRAQTNGEEHGEGVGHALLIFFLGLFAVALCRFFTGSHFRDVIESWSGFRIVGRRYYC